MLTISIVKARIRRQLIKEAAGKSYLCPENISLKIPVLQNKEDEQFLFGMYDLPEKWTVLSVTKLYGCYQSNPFEVILSKECSQIDDFIYQQTRKGFIDVELKDGRKIWMKSVGLSCAIRNIMEMLRVLPSDIILEP